jgi:hypothetical protein
MGTGTDWPLDFSRTTVGSVSSDRERSAWWLRTAVDVDNVFQAVDGVDLALTALVGATDDLDLVLRKSQQTLIARTIE